MSAAGRVVTGYSKPKIADYSCTGGVISYTNGMSLARGVDVDISPEESDADGFYADNQLAESDDGVFTSGTLGLTVDGLKPDAEKSIQGLPVADEDGFLNYNDKQKKNYKGFGYITRYQSDGEVTFVPTIVVKTKFNQIGRTAKTQEESKDYQTQPLTARIFRGDDADHTWLRVSETEYDTEAEAEAVIDEIFGITSAAAVDDGE